MNPTERLDAIEARAAAATPGPWEETATLTVDGVRSNNVTAAEDYDVCEVPRTPQGAEDSYFIAHARQDVPALVAALRAVLGLHREFRVWDGARDITSSERRGTCRDCYAPMPCSTVRAITAALDGAA